MIDPKDRSQLLRMAGNIAGGLLAATPEMKDLPVAVYSAKLAMDTLREVDRLIEEENGAE
jgi:hypothetical protein